MKHNISQKKLNRTTSHRKALLMNLSNALLKHEQIKTTLPKAKELKPFIEKIITLGKKENLHSRRKASSILHDEKNIKKLFEVFAQRYKDRNGGYTKIIKLSNRKEGVEFNAHRIFNPEKFVYYFTENDCILDRFHLINDRGQLILNSNFDEAKNLNFGGGYFVFKKK